MATIHKEPFNELKANANTKIYCQTETNVP